MLQVFDWHRQFIGDREDEDVDKCPDQSSSTTIIAKKTSQNLLEFVKANNNLQIYDNGTW